MAHTLVIPNFNSVLIPIIYSISVFPVAIVYNLVVYFAGRSQRPVVFLGASFYQSSKQQPSAGIRRMKNDTLATLPFRNVYNISASSGEPF